jgi:hypothetical protein
MSLLCHFDLRAIFRALIGNRLRSDLLMEVPGMPAAAIAETALALSTQRLLFAGQPILVHTNSPQLAAYARGCLPDGGEATSHVKPARAAITVHVRESDEACESAPHFRARGNFAFARFTLADSFWFNLRTREVFGTCSPELADDYRRWRSHIFPALLGILSASIGVAPVHAACLVHKGKGILLAGRSGTGKSTLTIAMTRRGYELLSDDWTYLSDPEDSADREAVQAWGLPVPVKLLPDASSFFPELHTYQVDVSLNGEIAYEFFPEESFGIERSLRCPVRAVVLLERGIRPGCSMLPISSNEAIEPLGAGLADCYRRQLDLIRRAVKNAPCHRFSFNDHPEKAAHVLDEALAGMS